MDSEAVWQAVLDAQKRTALACARQEQGQELGPPTDPETDSRVDAGTVLETERGADPETERGADPETDPEAALETGPGADPELAFAGDGDAFDQVMRLDGVAVRLCRHNQRTRLRIGEALAALGPHGHQELGFSTFGAYAAERCSRSGTWAARSRRVAKRLSDLPLLHKAVVCGELGWCMVELIAKYATPLTEASILQIARNQTVRAMRQALETADRDQDSGWAHLL